MPRNNIARRGWKSGFRRGVCDQEGMNNMVEGLKQIGVDHACALMIPADSMAEFDDQVEWFAKTVM